MVLFLALFILFPAHPSSVQDPISLVTKEAKFRPDQVDHAPSFNTDIFSDLWPEEINIHRGARVELVVEAVLQQNGMIEEIRLMSCKGVYSPEQQRIFFQKVADVLKASEFQPGMKDGRPVDVDMEFFIELVQP